MPPEASRTVRHRSPAGGHNQAEQPGDPHLVVRVGHKRVAVAMSDLRSVVPAPPVCRLPSRGSAITGLAMLGGDLVAIADLRHLMGTDTQVRPADRLLVLQDGDSALALRVDGIEGQTKLLHRGATGNHAGFVGCVPAEDLVLLDTSALLRDPRLSSGDSPPED